jgi:hypothetical protein
MSISKQTLETVVCKYNGCLVNYLTKRETISEKEKQAISEAIGVNTEGVEALFDELVQTDGIEVVKGWIRGSIDPVDDCYFVNVR